MNHRAPIRRILFYTHSPRAFRGTLIGHLYDLCQVYPTVLLAEALDAETEAALRRRDLFPRLEEILPVRQFSGGSVSVFAGNRSLYRTARAAVEHVRPDVVASASDMHSLFELYLFRLAKREGALTVTFQSAADAPDEDALTQLVDRVNAYTRMPGFLPLELRLLVVRWRKRFGHALVHWCLPLLVGERPLTGRSSFILRRGNSGMRDADYHLVFSRREYEFYRRAGVSASRLRVLSHPLARASRKVYEDAYFTPARLAGGELGGRVVLAVLGGEGVGFRRGDFRPIPAELRRTQHVEITRLMANILTGWMVLVKPHPDAADIREIKQAMASVSAAVRVIDPAEPIDRYITLSTAVIGLPRASSTALLTAAWQRPEIAVLALDFDAELFGDVYKDAAEIEYVSKRDDLVELLARIRDGRYTRRPRADEEKRREDEFTSTAEAVQTLYEERM